MDAWLWGHLACDLQPKAVLECQANELEFMPGAFSFVCSNLSYGRLRAA